MIKPSSVIRQTTTLGGFFKRWLIMLRPYHGLTDTQISVAAAFLKARYELSKVISNENLLDENVMSESTRRKIREECNVSNAHFQVIMGDLRKHEFIIDNKINPRYIPRLNGANPKDFSLMIYFVFEDDGTRKDI